MPTADKIQFETEQFYEQVREVLKSPKSQAITIVMGYLSAKVGHATMDGVPDMYRLNDRNERGDRFIQFAVMKISSSRIPSINFILNGFIPESP